MIGFINVNKPQGISSAGVVGRIKHNFKLDKIGHMGTLDPLACGVLPIAVGKATRLFDYFLNKQKTYIVEAEFGYETPSLDLGTEVEKNTTIIPSYKEICDTTSKFLGVIKQLPPIYSAKNINGEKAYNLARKGQNVQLKPVDVEIFKFKCLEDLGENKFKFLIECSSGTYVRSLIRDLGYNLNSLATVTFLQRAKTGAFDINNSVNLDDLLKSNINDYIVPIEKVFSNYKIIDVNETDFFKLKNGLTIDSGVDDKNIFIRYKTSILGIADAINGKLKLKTYLYDEEDI
ncbi:MAG: tRNA pseudouridine(55) synthase TruB [Eubacteriales bacterium]|nr:tRNA pseudouridine(55) synthase TruB [Eubacteriales bacterium]